MDSFISTALEEICAEGPGGMSLEKLWSIIQNPIESFGLQMDDAVKEVIWRRLLALPELLFRSPEGVFCPQDPIIKPLGQAEQMEMKIIAEEHLRDSFLGILDLKASNVEITPILKQILERLAIARTTGIAQSQLSKEFKMKENKLFYHLKRLESQGLIIRQSTILRTKEGDSLKDAAIVNTNMVYLCRYAKRLGSLQRVEITTPNLTSGDPRGDNLEGIDGEESVKEDVSVKDYLPEMKAICDMLDESTGKVLVVSDIKVARGYKMSTGHRSWRNICNRMKDACLVEEFMGKVNGKVVKCLRLLKKFDPKDFQPKIATCGYKSFCSDPLQRCSRRGQITDQFVELPLEHRIYDIIDGEGSKGITIPELSKRLGISSKKTETRICDMCWRMPKRFPMHMRFENHNRTKVYRVWTLGNFQGNSSDGTLGNGERDLMIPDVSGHREADKDSNEQSVRGNPPLETLLSGQVECALIKDFLPRAVKDKSITSVEEQVHSQVIAKKAVEHDMRDVKACKLMPTVRSLGKHPSAVTVDSAQREERILGRLKNEKFLLTAELHKWLESLEKYKQTTMARKTLTRSLQKLQQEGYCKCIQISMPILTNCNRNRSAEVILHPSIEDISSEFLGQIHQRLREFDMQSRGQGLDRPKNENKDVSELTGVKRPTSNIEATDSPSIKVEHMRINGFVPAIMVRAKLLHNFLWSFVCDLPGQDNDIVINGEIKDSMSSCSMLRSFSLGLAIENMQFETFLQVVGSDKCFHDLAEKCKLGLRLCDLPPLEFKGLMDTHATGRLSRVIDILYRLKLIQLATEGLVANMKKTPLCLSTYSLELKPFIEVPRNSSSADALSPRLRHDFLLTNKEAVDSYWQTLEYCHVSADRNSASKAFPGSAVKEIFVARSWTSIRVMSAEQNSKLLERMRAFAPKKKVPFVECVKISKELDLTLEQVLRVSSGMRQGRFRRFLKNSNGGVLEMLDKDILNLSSPSQKRKGPGKFKSSDRVQGNGETEETGSSKRSRITDDDDYDGKTDEISSNIISNTSDDIKMHFPEDNEIRKDCVEYNITPPRPSALFRRKKHPRKFYWNHQLDRRLIIEYVKYRAPFGAKFCRVDWTSVNDLPADPDICRRRMYYLNREKTVRKKVMKLCNIVSSRYARFLRESKEGREIDQNNPKMKKWDDFDDVEVKKALDEVLHFKSMANLGYNKIVKSKYKELGISTVAPDSDLPARISPGENEMLFPTAFGDTKADWDPELFCCSSNGVSARVYKHVRDSLSVSNAVELFKLIFLSTSVAPEVRSLLAETLKWYSEADLTMAFNYLKEMKLAEHAHGNLQIVLSQRFFFSSYSSPFPVDTGKRAAKLSAWLWGEDKKLDQDEINLDLDLQCGEIFQLLALISCGSLSIQPCLPEEGVGEANHPNYSTPEAIEGIFSSDEKITSKQKVWWRKEGESCNRREKGFPGIKMLLKRKEFSTAEILASHPESSCPVERNELLNAETFSDSYRVNRTVDPVNVSLDESIWESMAAYASRLNSEIISAEKEGFLSPRLIKEVYCAVLQAGEEGLRKEELSESILMHDDELFEIIADTLGEFQLAVKVNGYNHVRVVDSSYKSKYFIATLEESDPNSAPENSQRAKYDISRILLRNPENTLVSDDVTRFHSKEGFLSDIREICMESAEKGYFGSETKKTKFLAPVETRRWQAIFPWINGDGSTNDLVYKGLVRRILGIVMQNPGILEDEIMNRMIVLNPQSCRRLLDLMVLDNHIIMKKMLQATGSAPPSILGDLFPPKRKSAEATVLKKHYFANPMSASML